MAPAFDASPAPPGGQQPGGQDNTFYSTGYAVKDGDLIIYQTERPVPDAPTVTIAPPLGRRDPQRPLRGRQDVVGRLIALLPVSEDHGPATQSSQPRAWLLHGLGGNGKTSIALELAYLAVEKHVEVWWIERATLLAGLRAVGRRLGANEQQVRSEIFPDLLWTRLNAYDRPWLLVVDGIDDPNLLTVFADPLANGRGLIRNPNSSARGLVVATSRNGNRKAWGPWWNILAVGMLNTVAAGKVLRDYANAGTEANAEALAARLGGLPLALRLAGTYLAETTTALLDDPNTITTFVEYRDELHAGNLDVLAVSEDAASAEEDEEERARRIIGRTWELSLDLIARRGQPLARPLHRLLACLADADVPYRLLLDPPAIASSPLFAGQDSAGLSRLLRTLADFGLVELVESADTIAGDTASAELSLLQIHPLVRETSRRQPDLVSQPVTYLILAARLMHRAARQSEDPEDPRTWHLWQKLTPHCTYLLRSLAVGPATEVPADTTGQAAFAAFQAARYLYARGLYEQAEVDLQTVLTSRERQRGDEEGVLETRHWIAAVLRERGQWEDAEAAFRAVREARNQILGEEHPDTLETQQQLAITLAYQGKSAEAKDLYQMVYQARKRLLGDTHADTLDSRLGLACRMYYDGQLEEAEAEFRAVYEAVRHLPDRGDSHPSTLDTRAWLAAVARERGRLDEAEAEYRAVYESRRRVLTDAHPSTVDGRYRLAEVLLDQGQFDAAVAEYRGTLDTQRRLLGDDHSDTLTARHWLAAALRDGGHLDAAETEYRAVLEARRRLLGDEHPNTLASRYGLALVLEELGQLDQAEAEFRVTVEGYELVSGDESRGALTTRYNLALLLWSRGRLEESEVELRRILDAEQSILGHDDASTLLTRRALAGVFRDRGARLLFDTTIFRLSEPEGTVDMPDNGNRSGQPMSHYQQALNAFQEALNLTDPETDPGFYGVVLHDIADAHKGENRLVEAAATYQESADYKRRANNPRGLATTLYALGQVNEQLGQQGHKDGYIEGLAAYQEANQLLASIDSAEPTERVAVLQRIARIFRALHRPADAQTATEEAGGILTHHAPVVLSGDNIVAVLSLADLLIDCDRLAQASKALERAKELLNTGGGPSGRARADIWHAVGRAHERIGDQGQQDAYAEAVTAYEQALALLDGEAEPGAYAVVLRDIADVHEAEGRLQEAASVYQRAANYMRRTDASRALASILVDLGRIHCRLGRTDSNSLTEREEDHLTSESDLGVQAE